MTNSEFADENAPELLTRNVTNDPTSKWSFLDKSKVAVCPSVFVNDSVETARPVKEVTNYQYEEKLQTDRRNIFLLKPRYTQIALDDLEILMTYKKGSSQYKTKTLKTGDNIRLF